MKNKDLNNNYNTLTEYYNPPKKTKQQIDKEYYQKHKEFKKQQRRERYQQQKILAQQQEQEQSAKYYSAEAIKVLISLKEYTELNQEKQKLWHNFIWTFKDLNKTGFHNIIQIMKIREEADKLINDYWTTARKEIQKGRNWNSLSEAEKTKLIKHWGQEKARWENNLLTELEQQEQKGKTFEKDLEKQIELSKFHEKRGKIKCDCYSCSEIKNREKSQLNQILKEEKQEKEECSQCGRKVNELDEENDICKRCAERYE